MYLTIRFFFLSSDMDIFSCTKKKIPQTTLLNSRLFNKKWKMQILDECEPHQSHESEITFQLVSNTVLFLVTPPKSVVFWSSLREKKIYSCWFVKQETDSCVEFLQTTDSCIWICMDSNGPCLLFRPLL